MAEDDSNTDSEKQRIEPLEEIERSDQSPADRGGPTDRVRVKIAEARSVLESKRRSSHVIDAAFHAGERSQGVPTTLLAGALASRLVIYTIPFLVLVVITTGAYSQFADASPAETARAAGMAGLLTDAVSDSTSARSGVRIATVLAMAFATVWAAQSLGKLVRRIHALVWVVPLTRLKRRWALPVVVIAASIGSLLISSLGIQAQEWPVALALGELLAEFLLVSLGWLAIAHLLPHDVEATALKHLLPGALLVGLGIVGMKAAMVLFLVPRSITLSARYGDIAWTIVLITWAYWLAFILVSSAELNAALFKSIQRANP
jgi:membrane protein